MIDDLICKLKEKDWETILYNIKNLNTAVFIKTGKIYILRRIRGEKKWKGFDILEAEPDWDFLIVLDSCRYDFFEDLNTIKGDLKKVTSQGCVTDTWLRRNFPNSEYDNIVYISSVRRVSKEKPKFNPLLDSPFNSSKFYDIIEAYGEDSVPEKGEFVQPSEVTEAALKAKKEHPDKRLIIHYFQPHAPYLDLEDFSGRTPLTYLNNGYTENEIKQAYRKNIKIVLEEIKTNLLPELNGNTVITGDHGELLGENRLWGHFINVPYKKVLEVPWLEVD